MQEAGKMMDRRQMKLDCSSHAPGGRGVVHKEISLRGCTSSLKQAGGGL